MSALRPVVSLRIFNDEKCFGPGVAQLLEQVLIYHSLRGAAISMGMAYSKAWTIIHRCEAALGFPLLRYTTGGKNGGGAVLTEQATALLSAYRRCQQRIIAMSETIFQEEFQEFL